MAKLQPFKDQMYKLMENQPDLPNDELVRRFANIGLNAATVRRWVRLARSGDGPERKIPTGRPAEIASKENISKLKKSFNHKDGRSQTRSAKKLGCSQPYISKMLKKYTKIRHFKKQKKPHLTDQQRIVARPKCRRLILRYGDDEFIIDDESYFGLSCATLPGNDSYYSDDRDKTPDKVKCYYKQKYPIRLLVWLAISPRGITQPYFVKSNLAINQEVYQEILKSHLIPFIKRYYSTGGYVFWPDLASSHYASSVQDYLKSGKVVFVPKDINPANVPKARPIEDFWGTLKQKVYEK